MENEENKIEKLFGIDKETFEKSKNILPVLDTGTKLSYGVALRIEFLEDFPKNIETPNSKYKKDSTVINVKDLDKNMEYSLFLSSKTLRMGLAKVFDKYKSLKGKKVQIVKSKAVYSNFGENVCYIVQEIQ